MFSELTRRNGRTSCRLMPFASGREAINRFQRLSRRCDNEALVNIDSNFDLKIDRFPSENILI